MKTMSRYGRVQTKISVNKGFAVETTFVLFFLAVEFGRSLGSFTIDSVFLAVTLLMVIVLPYFLSPDEKPGFESWLLGRSFISIFAVLLGLMFKQSLGVILPETFRFLPMTLLIVTAMFCCYIQFYGFLKLRLAK
ncbi:MAG: hypothetical protein M3Q33_09025 [Acidobacteriota bacterium]|nr:hypothetical protein [Acidobacteriota bacterium]